MDTPKMSILNFQSNKHTPKNNKKRLTQDQVRLLESSFNSHKKLEPEDKLWLARALGLPPRRIAIWYQNKRARWKAQNLELDYNGLQQRLEIVVAEKRKLERHVERLEKELAKAQEMLIALNQRVIPPSVSSISTTTSCDEGVSNFGMHEEVTCGLENDEVWQLEKLYDCFMGANGSNWD